MRQFQGIEGRVVEAENHLEERVITQAAFWLERFHHFLEGQVLVLIGVQRHLAHPCQQLSERRIARQISA